MKVYNSFDEEVRICMECDHWDWRFETDSMVIGYCSILKKDIEGVLDPYFNKCPLIK